MSTTAAREPTAAIDRVARLIARALPDQGPPTGDDYRAAYRVLAALREHGYVLAILHREAEAARRGGNHG